MGGKVLGAKVRFGFVGGKSKGASPGSGFLFTYISIIPNRN